MHPDQVSDRAGTCPICGMHLVRAGDDLESEGHGESGHGGAEDDPHAQHRQMLDSKGYTRTVHPYDPPDLPLVTADGRRTSLHQVLAGDRPVLLNFIFTTCTTICPALSATFAQVQSQLGSEAAQVYMVSISIDPEYDTPEQLRAYAQRFSAGPQWSFLTGDLKDVVAVQRAFDAYRGSKMNHPPLTFLRAAAGGPWVRLDGIASGADVVRELHDLVKG
jgi:protein SCO1/2